MEREGVRVTEGEKIKQVLAEIQARSEERTARIYRSGDPDAKYDSAAAGEALQILMNIDDQIDFEAWRDAGDAALLELMRTKRETRGHGIGIVGSIHSDLIEIAGDL